MITRTFESLFNISRHELSRTSYAWFIRFLFRVGFLVGWTSMISIFVSRFDIGPLPLLFLLQAVFTVLGVLISSVFVEKMHVRSLIVLNVFLAGGLVLASTFFFNQQFLFFAFVLLASGAFLPQITILLSNYIEEFFTPHECERIFPLIESAETTAGIVAGILLSQFATYLTMERFLYLWVFLLFLFLASVFIFQPQTPQFQRYLYEMTPSLLSQKKGVSALDHGLKEIKRLPFLRILLVVFLFQGILFLLVEFQFTKVVHESVAVHGSESGSAEALAQGLGSLEMIFFSMALLMQLLFASRLLKALGTFGGFLLHSFISLLGSVSMLFGFSSFTTMLLRNNFEMSGVMFKNAYEASYYAFRHGSQRSIRETLEGIIAPLAAFLATLLLLFIEYFFLKEHVPFVLNIVLFSVALVMFIVSFSLQNSYTKMVRQNLLHGHHLVSREYAIDILAQKGHRVGFDILFDTYSKISDSRIKEKIFEVLVENRDERALQLMLDRTKSSDTKEILHALKLLTKSSTLKNITGGRVFRKQMVLDHLRDGLHKTSSDEVRESILKVLLKYDHDAISFVLQIMSEFPSMREHSIHLLGAFCETEKKFYLEKYLNDPSPSVKAATIAALWDLKEMKSILHTLVEKFYHSRNIGDVLAFCSHLVDLAGKRSIPYLVRHIYDEDMNVKIASSLALMKLDHSLGFKTIAQLLLGDDLNYKDMLTWKLRTVSTPQRRHLAYFIQRELLLSLHLDKSKNASSLTILEYMSDPDLEKIEDAFRRSGCYYRAEHVRAILNYRSRQRTDEKNSSYLVPEFVS